MRGEGLLKGGDETTGEWSQGQRARGNKKKRLEALELVGMGNKTVVQRAK